jgi:hypothetical protein
LVDLRKLEDVSQRFGEVVVDPSIWPDIMEGICKAVGASAAILLQSDVRTPDVPHTESIAEGIRQVFQGQLASGRSACAGLSQDDVW